MVIRLLTHNVVSWSLSKPIYHFPLTFTLAPNSFPTDAAINECLLADRRDFRKRRDGLHRRRQKAQPFEQGLLRLVQAIQSSRDRVVQRRSLGAPPHYPAELPISERRDAIARLIERHQVVIVCGETGSGKSTQLPKICLELGRGVFGRIGHTQPRRIAARSLATRISAELGSELGSRVGYKVRFGDRVGPNSSVKLMTDGILLAEIQQDRYLEEYDTLIIDEAHERSLNIDFLLGYLKQLLPRRPDLKLVITSATIDPQSFSQHFFAAPIIEVSGRTFPVEVRYRAPEEDAAGERDDFMQRAIIDAVDELDRLDRGDMLIFLSGEREIRETAESLRKHHMLQRTEVLPLYARLGPAEQGRIFHSRGDRRIILATNVAETSLTVPGIRYVIDAGFARISRYSHRSKVQRLPVERISQASAEQRKGRCGRVAAGVCIRLYTEQDFTDRRPFTEPEILRTNLAAVILQMKAMGLGQVEDFPFVEPPDSRQIADGYRLLQELGAIGVDLQITNLGRRLARLPVDPRIGRILFAAAETHCLTEVMIIGAALSVQDPRERPMDKQEAADQIHATFRHEDSDFLGLITLWRFLEKNRTHLSKNKYRKLCKTHFFSWNRVQEWHDVHQQLRLQMHEMGFRDNQADAGYEEVHRALLTGFLDNVGFRGDRNEYLGVRNSRFFIFPGSTLFAASPKWLVAAERVETTRHYARMLAKVNPAWIEAAASHLVKRSYSEPHWESRNGQVAAYEKVVLYGLTLSTRRRVNYGPINPQEAREIFIRFALVEGDYQTKAPFFRHNQELIEQVRDLEHRVRRQDLLADEQTLYTYYDLRIPQGIYNRPLFEKWLRKATEKQPKLLHMRRADLLVGDASGISGTLFPGHLRIAGTELPLEYRFQPGADEDGVTLLVPLPLLKQIPSERCEWLVPGLIQERITALLRSLPKALRKAFVPIPDTAAACSRALTPSDRPLLQALAEQLKIMTQVHVPEDSWNLAAIPEYLAMNFRVLDDKGDVLASGRDLIALQQKFNTAVNVSFQRLPSSGIEREDIRRWDFGALPESVPLQRQGITLRGFPALVDQGDRVALQVLESPQTAQEANRAGLRRLFMLQLGQDMHYLKRQLPGLNQMRLQYAKAGKSECDDQSQQDMEHELLALIIDRTFIEGKSPVHDEAEFTARLQAEKGQLMVQANEVCGLVDAILQLFHGLRKSLSDITQVKWQASVQDMQAQLNRLVFNGFLLRVDYENLRHYPRYLSGIKARLDKLASSATRDQQRISEMQELTERWQSWEDRLRMQQRRDERIEEVHWMLEELRISLFAQELKTAYPVSVKRIEKRWRELGL